LPAPPGAHESDRRLATSLIAATFGGGGTPTYYIGTLPGVNHPRVSIIQGAKKRRVAPGKGHPASGEKNQQRQPQTMIAEPWRQAV